MTVTKKTYNLSKIKQLIDLNGDITNFELTFNVKTKGSEEFEALVVDQETLDSGTDLPYKKMKGGISGNVRQDRNIYQNYFLILKTDQPCECEVTIDINEVDPVVEEEDKDKEQHLNKSILGNCPVNWTYMAVFGAAAAIILFLWFRSVGDNKSDVDSGTDYGNNNNNGGGSGSDSGSSSSSSSNSSSKPSSSTAYNLLSRLNALKVN